MISPDTINGAFETLGGFFILLSVLKLHREKTVRGVSWLHTGFFTTWGLWNIFYYADLHQWMSWTGGLFLAATNTIWLLQIVYYQNKERSDAQSATR